MGPEEGTASTPETPLEDAVGGAALGDRDAPGGAGESPPDGGQPATVPAGGRRRRVEGGRAHVVKVRLTDEEHAALRARASAAQVSAQRLLLEAALGPAGSTPPERRAWFAALLAARRQLAGAANNLNQLTRLGNIDKAVPAGVGEATAAVEDCADRLGEVLEDFER